MIFLGIDISKLTFDVAYFGKNKYINRSFDNKPKGFQKLLTWIKKLEHPVYICLEATGIYSFDLAQYLVKHKQKVMVVNPIITHAFFKVELGRNKTDKADAQLISRYCEHMVTIGDFERKAYRPKDAEYEALQRLVTRCDQLEKSKTQENNRLEASKNKFVSRSIKRLIKVIESEIDGLKEAISTLVEKNSSLKKQVDLLVSINGIGERTAWSILAYIGDIQFFANSSQVASYAGLAPKIVQSGTSVNKSSLSKLGHKHLRKSLYMPALAAIRYNPFLKSIYERLVNNGKPKKVAVIAIMRKLLTLSYAILKSEKPFDENYQMAV